MRGICVCGAWVYSFYIGACNLCLESSINGIRCIRCSGMVDDSLIQDEMLLGLKFELWGLPLCFFVDAIFYFRFW